MTTLITGAAGFTGVATARELVRRGEAVVGFDLARPRGQGGGGASIEASIEDMDAVASAIKEHRVDRILHMAALHGAESEHDPHRSVVVNVCGTDVVFEAARRAGIARVVFTSSIAVYGPQSFYGCQAVDEETAGRPTLAYGAAKAVSEFMAKKYHDRYGLEAVTVRLSVVFGHGRSRGPGAMWPSDFASLPAVGAPAHIPLSAEEECSLIYIEDAARLLAMLVLAPQVRFTTYLSGGSTVKLREIVPAVRRWLPEARIDFAEIEPGRLQYPSRIRGVRVEEEFGFVCPPFGRRVLDHLNAAREAAGLRKLEA